MKKYFGQLSLFLAFLFVFSDSSHGAEISIDSWGAIPIEKRCDGFWRWLHRSIDKSLSGWSFESPKCAISGGGNSSSTWSLDVVFLDKKEPFELRFQIIEANGSKPAVEWCLLKGGKFGCASPWEDSFSRGELFKSKDAAKKSYGEVIARAKGFLEIVSNMDSWVGKSIAEPTLYGVTYTDWVIAWSSAKRSLPVNDELFTAAYKLNANSPKTGSVKPVNIPKSLKECLKCASDLCDKTPLNFEFSGTSLTVSRNLSPDETKASGQKTASVSWLMIEQTPFIKGKPAWPMLCGAHRFNIQKF
jgi:hypothetical protein